MPFFREEATPTPKPVSLAEGNPYLDIQLECPPIGKHCFFVVNIGPFNRKRFVNLTLSANHGIYFRDDLLSHQNITLSEDKLTATSEDISIEPGGQRLTRFPFSIKEQTILAGEYVVDVIVTTAGPLDGDIVSRARVKAFVSKDDASLHLLETESEFDKAYPFEDDTMPYLLRLDSVTHPRSGHLLIKLTASHDEYNPDVIVHVDSGIEFLDSSPINTMLNEGGCRMLDFYFRIVEDERPSDGRYVISVSVIDNEYGTAADAHEILPIAVNITSEANTHQQQWLAIVPVTPFEPDKKAIEYLVQQGGSETEFSQTVSTGSSTSISIAPAAATSTAVPPQASVPAYPPTSTSMPQSIVDPAATLTPSPAPAVMSVSTQYTNNSIIEKKPDCSTWQYPVPLHGDDISLWKAYQNYAAGKITMDLNNFVAGFRHCNGVTESVIILHADRSYVFPNGSRP